MNRMIGVGEFCTSSITERSRCSNSPFIEAPACIRPISSAQSLDAAQRRRHVAGRDALGEALDDRGLADAGLAGEDRIVLPPPHQHVDDLADLLVAAEDRVHLAATRALAVRSCEKRSSAVVPRGPAAASAPGVPAARSPEPSIGRRFSSSEFRQIVRCSAASVSTLILPNSLRQAGQGAPQLERLERADQQMAGADLRLAEKQRRVVPAAVEHIDAPWLEMPGISVSFLRKPSIAAPTSASAAWRGRA